MVSITDKIKQAVEWAVAQEYETEEGVFVPTISEPFMVVDKVREFLNENSIEYNSFSYDDIIPYLPN